MTPAPTFVALLQARAEAHPEKLLYRYLLSGDVDGPTVELTYGDLDRRARAIGATLRREAPSGARALLIHPPGLEFVAAFMGCLYGGIVAVPAYPPDPHRPELAITRLRAILRDAQVSAVLTTRETLVALDSLFSREPVLSDLIRIATDDVPDGAEASFRAPDVEGGSLAFLQYTSGSTGSPKGVMVTHANLLHNAGLIARAFGNQPSSVGVGWLPLYHDMGLIGNVLQPLYSGIECTLMSPIAFLLQPMRWLRAIAHYKASVSGGPNFAYELCCRRVMERDLGELDLSSWELAFNGAEPVRQETLDRFAETFARCGFRKAAFYPCYGLAEATLFVTGGAKLEGARSIAVSSAGDGKSRTVVSSGRLRSDQRVVVVDPERLAARSEGEEGAIWVQGAGVGRGYWNNPEATRATFAATLADESEGTFLRTGDLGFVSGGELFVTGRLKDLVIVHGRNYHPQDIEQTAERQRGVRSACVAAFSVEIDGEEGLGLAAEVDAGVKPDQLPALAARIRRAVVEDHDVPLRALVLVKARSLPKTSSGKVRRHQCRDLWAQGGWKILWDSRTGHDGEAAGSAARTPLATDTERTLAALWKQVLGIEDVGRESHLLHLGADSIRLAELCHRISETTRVGIGVEELFRHPRLEDLAAVIDRSQRIADTEAMPLVASSPSSGEHPVGRAQRGLWLLDRMSPGSAAYHIPLAVQLDGALDVESLRRCLEEIVRRHDVLRTRLVVDEGCPEAVIQVVRDPSRWELPVVDVAGLGDDAIERLLGTEAREPFVLAAHAPMRATLYRRSERAHVLVLVFHHIAFDGWSAGVLVNELNALYPAFQAGGRSPLAPLPVQYADWAAWERVRFADERPGGAAGLLEGPPRTRAAARAPGGSPRASHAVARGGDAALRHLAGVDTGA